METNAERRVRKLRWVCQTYGGHQAVAIKSNLNPQYLDQILKGVLLPPRKDGTQTPRRLGDDAVVQIEAAYGLGAGWFDRDDSASPPDTLPITAIVHALANLAAGMTPNTRSTIAAILSNAITNPATANECATAISALAAFGNTTYAAMWW